MADSKAWPHTVDSQISKIQSQKVKPKQSKWSPKGTKTSQGPFKDTLAEQEVSKRVPKVAKEVSNLEPLERKSGSAGKRGA